MQIPEVVVINYRGKNVIQNKAYTDIANKINYNFYTHLITIDADEFIELNKFKNIKDYLTYYKINSADQIKLNWKLYLDDGTMIVVEGGRKHIGQTTDVVVTSVLQTAAGRMIFAKPKDN